MRTLLDNLKIVKTDIHIIIMRQHDQIKYGTVTTLDEPVLDTIVYPLL